MIKISEFGEVTRHMVVIRVILIKVGLRGDFLDTRVGREAKSRRKKEKEKESDIPR